MLKPTQEIIGADLNALFETTQLLSIKNKNISENEKVVIKEKLFEQCYQILNNTYSLLEIKNESAIFSPLSTKLENNFKVIDSLINEYNLLKIRADNNQDKASSYSYNVAKSLLYEFRKDSNKTLQSLRMIIASNTFLDNEQFYISYMPLLKRYNLKEYERTLKRYESKRIYNELYNNLEGYQITHKKIILSSGLKIFNLLHLITKVQKKAVTQNIEYLFATLGEEVNIDEKRASKIQTTKIYKNNLLFEYERKQQVYDDYNFSEAFFSIYKSILKQYKKANQKELIIQMNKNYREIERHFIQQIFS